MPVIGYLNRERRSEPTSVLVRRVVSTASAEVGYVEGRNVTIE